MTYRNLTSLRRLNRTPGPKPERARGWAVPVPSKNHRSHKRKASSRWEQAKTRFAGVRIFTDDGLLNPATGNTTPLPAPGRAYPDLIIYRGLPLPIDLGSRRITHPPGEA